MNCDEELSNQNKCPFHPADPPHGSRNYELSALEPDRQKVLNKIKLTQRHNNEVYLNRHPEIRALVSIMIRHLLEKEATSRQEIQSLLAKFFDSSRTKVAAKLLDYFLEINYQGPIVESLREEIAKGDIEEEEGDERLNAYWFCGTDKCDCIMRKIEEGIVECGMKHE